MANKSLTHIFMIMREKAIRSKNVYQIEEEFGDREALVPKDKTLVCRPLPEWTTLAEEVRYNCTQLASKTKKLHTLQSNLVCQPSMEDNSPEEQQMTTLTTEITKILERCRGLVLQLSRQPSRGREEHFRDSVAKALMISLSEINNDFSSSCSRYTQSTAAMRHQSSLGGDITLTAFLGEEPPDENVWSEEQVQFLSSNHSAVIATRDKAVQSILRSTIHLNQLFRDVAHLVHEQGTLVDRIDCNIEQAHATVQAGGEQLRKANRHQSKSRNIKCILGLAVAVVVLVILLIVFKT